MNSVSALLLILLLIRGCDRPGERDNRIRRDAASSSLASCIRSLTPPISSGEPRKPVLGLFLRFVDFGCEVCLNNFLDFCDSVNSNAARYGTRTVVMVFQRDDNEESYQLKTLRKWSRACNLNYPTCLASPEMFEENQIKYSTAILLNGSDTIELRAQIPLSVETQKEFILRLFHQRD
jgi:hypothetical protein